MNGSERLEYLFGMFDWNVGEAFRVAHDFLRTCITGVQGKRRHLASLNHLNSCNASMW
jgi:hypothetical protein